MTEFDEVTLAAFDAAMQRAEPKLKAALKARGVSSPDELPPEVARQVFQEALVQTAAESFPNAQIDALNHGLTAFQHPLFGPAFSRVKAVLSGRTDAFEMVQGIDAAIVLAGFGLPVAPFDKKTPRILGELSNDIDTVANTFSRWKTALVGYSPCEVPFYMLVTDCMRTMCSQLTSRPELEEAKQAFERTGGRLPSGPFQEFQHGMVLIPRGVGDAASTVFLANSNRHQGSVGFYAGWTIDGTRCGVPNEGFVPVPLQFLRAASQDPQFAMWIWRPAGARIILN